MTHLAFQTGDWEDPDQWCSPKGLMLGLESRSFSEEHRVLYGLHWNNLAK